MSIPPSSSTVLRPLLIGGGAVSICALIGWLVFQALRLEDASPVPDVPAKPIVTAKSQPVLPMKSIGLELDQNSATEPWTSLSLDEWHRWSPAQRLDFITSLQDDSGLADRMISFLHRVIRDKTLDALTRNNASNVLVVQEKRDPELAALFRSMLNDPTEDDQWRDYALQFLATTLEWSADRAGMITALWQVAVSEHGSIAGTAMLHLHYLDEQSNVPLPLGYQERLMLVVTDPQADLASRVTIAGILGQRRVREAAPALRTLIKTTKEPAIRRAAIGALGQIGDQADRDLVETFLADADPLTSVSAHEAVLALEPPVDIEATSTTGLRVTKP